MSIPIEIESILKIDQNTPIDQIIKLKKWMHFWPGVHHRHFPWRHLHHHCCCCCCCGHGHKKVESAFSFDASIDLFLHISPSSLPAIGDVRAEFQWQAPSGSKVTIQTERHLSDGSTSGWTNILGLENLPSTGIRTWDPPIPQAGGVRVCFRAVTDQGLESEMICASV